MKLKLGVFLIFCIVPCTVFAWTPVAVDSDPLVRMPGSQPAQGIQLEASNRCLNCHEGYNQAVEPGFNWKGSMMAQAARDPIFWACLTVAAQDSIWAVGTPNAVDLCERCHFPEGWLAGRSDPPNVSAMTGSDYDGLGCDFCHTMWNPFFEETHTGVREGSDWAGYWDEAGSLSQSEAFATYDADMDLASAITTFSGGNFFANNFPKYGSYVENTSGQFFNSSDGAKRASFADHEARHQVFYSRYHKSKYMCGTCHDVSNPVLANLGLSGLPDQSGGTDQITEQYTPANYFHVERTFSEFMLSAFGQQGGAATNADFQAQGAPDIVWAAKCQDCHMRDVVGTGADKNGLPVRPTESDEHPASGMPLHDLTGGNAWISHILASLDPSGPVYDPVNAQILNQGPEVLTLDLSAGQAPAQNGAELKAGADRAKQQLLLAATIKDLVQVPDTSKITFKVQNNTGHKLISGFPEGRRMFVNIQAYAGGTLVGEINPYDDTVGTLKGLPKSGSSPQLSEQESYVDELVYEVHPKSDLTGEDETFHFVLATGRYKDNRIPPRGFDIDSAPDRICEPVWHGEAAPDYFTAAEYAGGYDEVTVTLPPETDFVDVRLFYQGTSREYIEFLRDEINGSASSLESPTPSGEAQAYIIQTDPFFGKLKEWGNVIWNLWHHNHGLDGSGKQVAGIVPFEMTQATLGVVPPPPCIIPATPAQVVAAGGSKSVTLTWQPLEDLTGGYRIYYDQAGKLQYLAGVDIGQTQYLDSDLTKGTQYCYVVTAWEDCNANGVFDEGTDEESAASEVVCTITDYEFTHCTGSLSGDLQEGVTVNLYVLQDSDWVLYTTAVTEVDGQYSFDELPEGTYAIEPVAGDGIFSPASYDDIVIPRNDSLNYDFTLDCGSVDTNGNGVGDLCDAGCNSNENTPPADNGGPLYFMSDDEPDRSSGCFNNLGFCLIATDSGNPTVVYSHNAQELAWSTLDDGYCCGSTDQTELGWQYREVGTSQWNVLPVWPDEAGGGAWGVYRWANVSFLTLNTVYEVRVYHMDCLGGMFESASVYVVRK